MKTLALIFILVCTNAFADISYTCPASGKKAITTSDECLHNAVKEFTSDCCFDQGKKSRITNADKTPWKCELKIKDARCTTSHDDSVMDDDSTGGSDRWICKIPSNCSDLGDEVDTSQPPKYTCSKEGAVPFFHWVTVPKSNSPEVMVADVGKRVLRAVGCRDKDTVDQTKFMLKAIDSQDKKVE
jgi:hypothetical protein